DEGLAQRAEAKRGRAEEPADAEHREEAEDDGQDRGVVAATHAEEPHVRMRKAEWQMNAYAHAAADAREEEKSGPEQRGAGEDQLQSAHARIASFLGMWPAAAGSKSRFFRADVTTSPSWETGVRLPPAPPSAWTGIRL